MLARTLSVVAVRLFAIYFMVRGIGSLGGLLGFALPGLPIDGANAASIVVASAIPGAVQLVAGAICWFGAAPLARLAWRGGDGAAQGGDADAAPSVRGSAAIAFFAFGVIFAATALPGLANALYLLGSPASEGYALSVYQLNQVQGALLGDGVRLIVGIVLAAGANMWARFGVVR